MEKSKKSLKLLKLKRKRKYTQNPKNFLHSYSIIPLTFVLLVFPIAYIYIYAILYSSIDNYFNKLPLPYYSLIMYFYTFITIIILYGTIIFGFQKYIINHYSRFQRNQIIAEIQSYLTIILLASTTLYALIHFFQIGFLPEEIQQKFPIQNWSESNYLLSFSGYFTLLKLFFTLYIKKLFHLTLFIILLYLCIMSNLIYLLFSL